MLTSSGDLLAWEEGSDGFAIHGRVAPQAAAGAVALLPPQADRASGRAPGSGDGAGFILTRGGTMIRLRDGPQAAWEARFAGFDGPRTARDAGAKDRRPVPRTAWRVACDSRSFLILTEWEGLFVSHDGGRIFAPVGGLPKEVRALTACSDDPRRWIAVAGDGLYRSEDCGRSWFPQGGGTLREALGDVAEVVALAAPAGAGEELLALTRGGVLLRSWDGGVSWERPLGEIHSRGHVLFAGESAVLLGTSRGVLSSADRGASWCWRNRGLRSLSVLSIGVAAPEESVEGNEIPTLIVDTDLGTYLSPDRGVHWDPAAGSVEAPAPQTVAQACLLAGAPFAGERIIETAEAPLGAHWVFVRTVDGLFASADQGTTWEEVLLPGELTVTSMALDLSAAQLLVGTARYGLFAAGFPEPRAASDLPLPLPVHASPNPFGGAVMLRCVLPPGALDLGESLSGQGDAEGDLGGSSNPRSDESLGRAAVADGEAAAMQAGVAIFSVHGQLVRRLEAPTVLSGVAGERSLLWDWNGLDERGQPVPSGMYLVSVTAGTQRFIGKIIKLR